MTNERLEELRSFVLSELVRIIPPDDTELTAEGKDLLALIDKATPKAVVRIDDFPHRAHMYRDLCPTCGASCTIGVLFCYKCGQALERE